MGRQLIDDHSIMQAITDSHKQITMMIFHLTDIFHFYLEHAHVFSLQYINK